MTPPLFAHADRRELSRLRRVLKGAPKGMKVKTLRKLRSHVAACLRKGV